MTPEPTSMLSVLAADGPDPALAGELALFGQFVGSWELDVTNYRDDGTSETLPGEWHFGWVLEGRAVQDVWIAPSREAQRTSGERLREYGTAVRFYDPALRAWRVAWSGPVRGLQFAFVAAQRGDEIVLDTTLADGTRVNWIFSEITERSFRWRSQESRDDGASWNVIQEMRVRRA